MKNFPLLPAGSRMAENNTLISGVRDGHDCFITWKDFILSCDESDTHTQSGGAGFDGTAEEHIISIVRHGGLIRSKIYVDITGLNSKATDGDIIGKTASGQAWFAHLTAARYGTIYKAWMECFQIPAGGDPNIALWEATEATGIEDSAIGDLAETELLQSQNDGTDWATGDKFTFSTLPTAGKYLYLVQGDSSGTTGTYTAGIFVIDLWGFVAS